MFRSCADARERLAGGAAVEIAEHLGEQPRQLERVEGVVRGDQHAVAPGGHRLQLADDEPLRDRGGGGAVVGVRHDPRVGLDARAPDPHHVLPAQRVHQPRTLPVELPLAADPRAPPRSIGRVIDATVDGRAVERGAAPRATVGAPWKEPGEHGGIEVEAEQAPARQLALHDRQQLLESEPEALAGRPARVLAEPRAAHTVAVAPDPARPAGVLAVVRAAQRTAPAERTAHPDLVQQSVDSRSLDPQRRHAQPRVDPRLDGRPPRRQRRIVVHPRCDRRESWPAPGCRCSTSSRGGTRYVAEAGAPALGHIAQSSQVASDSWGSGPSRRSAIQPA